MLETRTLSLYPPTETGGLLAPEPERPPLVPVTYNWDHSRQLISAVINLLNITLYEDQKRAHHIPPPDNMGVDLLYDLARPGSGFADFPHEMTLQIPSQSLREGQPTFHVAIPLPDFLKHITVAIEHYRETRLLATAPLQSTITELTTLANATRECQAHITFAHASQSNDPYLLETLEIAPLPPSEQAK